MESVFTKLDELIASFMQIVFEKISEFWGMMILNAGKGAYIALLLLGVFFLIIFLVGLFKLLKKFGFFLILIIITIGIPCLWYFVVATK